MGMSPSFSIYYGYAIDRDDERYVDGIDGLDDAIERILVPDWADLDWNERNEKRRAGDHHGVSYSSIGHLGYGAVADVIGWRVHSFWGYGPQESDQLPDLKVDVTPEGIDFLKRVVETAIGQRPEGDPKFISFTCYG